MSDICTLELDMVDVMQLLDALESRAASWENTLAFARGQKVDYEDGVIEEHKDADEAEAIAVHFRDVIHKIEVQMKTQQTDQ